MANNPGDIQIRTLSVDGKDLRPYLVSFTITESIMTNTIVIKVLINQQEALNLDLNSEGNSKLTFSSPEGIVKTYDNLKLDKISSQKNSNTQKNKLMQLTLIPNDTLKNRANPGYQRSATNTSVDKLVKTFLNELGTKYKVDVKESNQMRGKPNKQPFVVPARPVFGQVENLRKEATNDKEGDEWLFCLRTEGSGKLTYNFKPLSEFLKDDSGLKITNIPNIGINTQLGMPAHNAIRVNFLQDRDMFKRAGQSSWQATSYDMAKAKGENNNNKTGSDRENKVKNAVGLNKQKRASTETTKPASNPIFYDSNEIDIHKRGKLAPTGALTIADLTQGGVQVMIPLDTNIYPGMVLDLDLVEANESGPAKHATQSGKNIILSTFIYCGPITDNPRCTMILTCSNITPNKKSL